jgi:hypothetical protein
LVGVCPELREFVINALKRTSISIGLSEAEALEDGLRLAEALELGDIEALGDNEADGDTPPPETTVKVPLPVKVSLVMDTVPLIAISFHAL